MAARLPSPSLGVVVPALNEAVLLPRLLDRLAPRPGDPDRPDQLVVVDGGSRDGTIELCRRAGVRVLSSPPGRGRQLAAGARALRTGLLLFLHADSLPERGALAIVRRALAAGPLVGAGMRQRIEARGAFYRCVEWFADRRTRCGIVYGDCGLAVTRRAYDEVGGFAEIELFEDLDLARRLRRVGPVGLLADAVLRVSARRWQREGRWRCTLRNRLLTLAYLAGVSPRRLAVRYAPHCEAGSPEPSATPTPTGEPAEPS